MQETGSEQFRKDLVWSFVEALNSAGVDCMHYPYPSYEIDFSVGFAFRRLSPLLTLFGFVVFVLSEDEDPLLALPTEPISVTEYPKKTIWKYMDDWGLSALALEKGLGEEDLRRLLMLLSAPSRGLKPESGLRTYLERSGVRGVRVTRARVGGARVKEAVSSLRERRLAAAEGNLLSGGKLSCLEELGDMEVVELAVSLHGKGEGEHFGRIIKAIGRNLAKGGEASRRAKNMLSLVEKRLGIYGILHLYGTAEGDRSIAEKGSVAVSAPAGSGTTSVALPGADVNPGSKEREAGNPPGGSHLPRGSAGERVGFRSDPSVYEAGFPASVSAPRGGEGDGAAQAGVKRGDISEREPGLTRKVVDEGLSGRDKGPERERDREWATRVMEGNFREETCLEALRLLVDRGGMEAVEVVRRAFRHPLPGVRAEACRVARKVMEEGEAEEALLAAAVDPVPEVREAAVEAIGELGGERSEKFLLSLARDRKEAPEVRAAACRALAGVGGKKARKGLRKILERGSRGWFGEEPLAVMASACSSLGRIGEEKDAELVRTLMDNPEPLLREEARRAIKAMRSRGLRV